MSEEDFKRLLEDSLKPIRQEQTELRKFMEESLKPIREEQVELRKIIEERVLPPVIYVETTVKSYADRYVTNEDHIGRLQKRVGTVEDKLGIQPPQELTIPALD